jgi:hypothetical protein
MSGETTMVSPGRAKAANWKQRDLPPPVGSNATTSLPSRESEMICSWRGRKVEKPKYCFSNALKSCFMASIFEWQYFLKNCPRGQKKIMEMRQPQSKKLIRFARQLGLIVTFPSSRAEKFNDPAAGEWHMALRLPFAGNRGVMERHRDELFIRSHDEFYRPDGSNHLYADLRLQRVTATARR